jgi:type III secretion protein L
MVNGPLCFVRGPSPAEIAVANVIKGNRREIGGSGPRPPARGDRGDGDGDRAHQIVDEARRGAAAIVEEAHQTAAEMVRDAASQGQQEGFSQAEHMREQIQALEQRMLKEVEGEVVRAALRIAEKLLSKEMEQRQDAIADVAVAALQHISDAREVWLRVNPRQAAVLRRYKQRLVDSLSMAKGVDVREDKKVAPGGVLIQTESGVIDATLETQLAEIARVLGA